MQQRFFRGIILGLAGLALGFFFYRIRAVFVPFAIAVFLAYLIYPLVSGFETRGVSRTKAIITVYTAGAILIGLFLTFFVPTLLKEAKAFGEILPVYAEMWIDIQNYTGHLFERVLLPEEARQVLREMSSRLRNRLIQEMRNLAEGILSVLSLLPSFILAPFLAYYLVRDIEHLKKRFLSLLPPSCRSDVVYLLREADLIFSKFLRGHLLVSLIVGFLTGLGAALIGMRFCILIGIFTAIADLIPIFGPAFATVPIVGLALGESRLKGILMLFVFLFVQQLEGSILVPRLLGDRVGLHPLVVVLVLLVGGYLFGPLGVILAAPLAGLLRVVVRFIWAKVV